MLNIARKSRDRHREPSMAECLVPMHFLTFTVAFTLLLQSEVCAAVTKNVALTKSCWQSTTEGPYNASLAVDGLKETCARTAEEKGSRWSLDLGGRHTVTSVTIDAGEMFLGYMEIQVTNSQGGNPNDLCALAQPTEAANKATFSCYNPIDGRYVHITSPFTTSLRLCDVSVNECEDGLYGSKCDKVCHCKDNTPCSKSTGLCPGRCAAGYMGRRCQEACAPGMFGMDCLKTCHCKTKEFCNIEDGVCPSGCADTYLGKSCQTQIPFIEKPPVSQSKAPTSITLRWDPWKGELDSDMRIEYKVEYRLHQRHAANPVWESMQENIEQGSQSIMVARIGKLRISTHYNFRVTPYLFVGEEMYQGATSPMSPPYKTLCASPEPPDVEQVEAMVDEERNNALLTVRWMMLADSEVNCDSIKVYRVQYQERGETEWKTAFASLNTDVKNITGLQFSKEYLVQVVAVNNMDYNGFSPLYRVVTPDSSVAQPVISETDSNGILAGIIIGLVFSLIAVICVALFIYKKRQRKYNSVPDTSDHMEEKVPLNNVVTESISGSEVTGNCIGDKPEEKDSEADKLTMLGEPKRKGVIKVEELEQYIMERNRNDREKLRGEYEEVPMGFTAKYEHGKNNANKHKNRFVNIIPYDHSRLILDKVEGDPDSDYINANYIDAYKKPKAFVAAQGCNKYTIQDMWRMVWQVNSRRIIMITNLIENGKRKCDQYWPENGDTKQYHDLVVHNIETETTSDFIIRTFDLSKDGEKRTVKQFHFVAWPDHGVPTRASPIIAFRRKVRSYDDTYPGTIVVHCSAGVGRTGTFITLDALLDMAKDEGVIDVFGWVWNMRRDRVNMIQTVEQYLFVYDALLEALKAGNTAFGCSEFREKYEELKIADPEKGLSKLQQQFQTLAAMSPQVKTDDVKSGIMPENAIKNRNPDVLPADRHRPYLMLRVEGTNDYVNAIFLDGFRKRNSYIITQMPLPITVIDFWRMVYEHGCSSIVMLNPMDDNDESYGQYWLEDEGCECGPFIIEPHSTDTTNTDITVREIKLSYEPQTASVLPPTKKEEAPRIITQFQLNCWPQEEAVPLSKQAFIQLIDLVEKCQQKTGDGPVIIHCRDGVQQSGLYVAVSCIWEKMKVDQEVDIFNTVKHLRYHRPQIIANPEQYEFCYEMVLAYLAEFETYANFR